MSLQSWWSSWGRYFPAHTPGTGGACASVPSPAVRAQCILRGKGASPSLAGTVDARPEEPLAVLAVAGRAGQWGRGRRHHCSGKTEQLTQRGRRTGYVHGQGGRASGSQQQPLGWRSGRGRAKGRLASLPLRREQNNWAGNRGAAGEGCGSRSCGPRE